jgi:hypothetical protein
MGINWCFRIVIFIAGALPFCAFISPSPKYTSTIVLAAKEKTQCFQWLSKGGPWGREFANVRPNPGDSQDTAAYREYRCEGLESGAPVTGEIRGNFKGAHNGCYWHG